MFVSYGTDGYDFDYQLDNNFFSFNPTHGYLLHNNFNNDISIFFNFDKSFIYKDLLDNLIIFDVNQIEYISELPIKNIKYNNTIKNINTDFELFMEKESRNYKLKIKEEFSDLNSFTKYLIMHSNELGLWR